MLSLHPLLVSMLCLKSPVDIPSLTGSMSRAQSWLEYRVTYMIQSSTTCAKKLTLLVSCAKRLVFIPPSFLFANKVLIPSLTAGYPDDVPGFDDFCEYKMSFYPSAEYESRYVSNTPIYLTLSVIGVFLWVFSVFVLYDWLVKRRQVKLNNVATKSTAIVASLFPVQVRDKIFTGNSGRNQRKVGNSATTALPTNIAQRMAQRTTNTSNIWTTDLNGMAETNNNEDSPPIADLFPSATVVFMDIAGFTAWASQREPSQVFILLETIYQTFDRLAKRRKVFKVETIGDCYVAGKCQSRSILSASSISIAELTL